MKSLASYQRYFLYPLEDVAPRFKAFDSKLSDTRLCPSGSLTFYRKLWTTILSIAAVQTNAVIELRYQHGSDAVTDSLALVYTVRPLRARSFFLPLQRNLYDVTQPISVCVTLLFMIPTRTPKARTKKAKHACGLSRQALPPTPLTLWWDMKRDRVLQRKYLCVDTLKHTIFLTFPSTFLLPVCLHHLLPTSLL